MPVAKAFRRLNQSPVVWSWAFNGLRLATAVILLPLVLRPGYFGKGDLGMYYIFNSLSALAILFDFGFSPSIGRNVSYAMAGAHELTAEGHAATPAGGTPNHRLLWQLLRSTQRLFLYLSLATFVVLGAVGSFFVGSGVAETTRPSLTWIAWGLVLASAVLEIYAGWWNTFLRGMGQVLVSARISVISFGLRLALAAGLLLAGAGLLALPVAGLVSSVLQRGLSRRRCLAELGSMPDNIPKVSLIPVLWPNSWRTGLQFLSVYLATQANTLLCSKVLGVAMTGDYGLTGNVIGLIGSMSLVWTSVKWPLVGQYCKLHDFDRLRPLLWSRLWLQTLTFGILTAVALPAGPMLLRWIGSKHHLLPHPMITGMLAYSFLETQFTFWTTLLSLLRNRIPSLWPTVVTNGVTLCLVIALGVRLGPAPADAPALEAWTRQGLMIFTLVPVGVALLFNFWFWPLLGARSIGRSWWRFMFTRPV
jgi:hypothetical protein